MCYHPNVSVHVTANVSPVTNATEVNVASFPNVPPELAFKIPESCTAVKLPDDVNVLVKGGVLVPV